MANYCFSTVSFFGNDEVLKQVDAWNTALSSFAPTEEDPHCMRAIKAVFYPDVAPDEDIDLGFKWVHEDIDSTGAGDGELGLQSAWNSPDLFLEHLACTLYKVDQNGIISIVDDGYGIPNGPAFSPDGLYMLHTDSRFRKIYIFDYHFFLR